MCVCVCVCVYPVVHSSLCLCVRHALSSEGGCGGYVAAVTGISHEGAIHRWIAPRTLRRPRHSLVGMIRTHKACARVRFGGAATTIRWIACCRFLLPLRTMTLALLWCVGDTPLRHRRCTLDGRAPDNWESEVCCFVVAEISGSARFTSRKAVKPPEIRLLFLPSL